MPKYWSAVVVAVLGVAVSADSGVAMAGGEPPAAPAQAPPATGKNPSAEAPARAESASADVPAALRNPSAEATAPAQSTTSGASRTAASAPRVLDLAPPDIRKIVSPEELTATLEDPEDRDRSGEIPETIAVRGTKPTPEVPGGLASVFWAILHPTEAWRVLAPVQ